MNKTDFERIWFNRDCELITDELIKELMGKGIAEDYLTFMRERNYVFCRPRGSFVKKNTMVFPSKFDLVKK